MVILQRYIIYNSDINIRCYTSIYHHDWLIAASTEEERGKENRWGRGGKEIGDWHSNIYIYLHMLQF